MHTARQDSPTGALVHHMLDGAVKDAPESPAVRDSAGRWSYRQLARHSVAFAAWLRRQGLRPGDRVLIQLPACREFAAMVFGVSRAGAVLVPLDPMTKAFQLRMIVADAEPAIVITAVPWASILRSIASVLVHEVDHVWAEVEDLCSSDPEVEQYENCPSDPAVLIYTSGSTGTPKAVVCPHRQIVFSCCALTSVLGYRSADVVFCRFPLSWDYGLYKLIMTCCARCEIVLAGGGTDLTLLSRMSETGTTVVPIVPSFAAMILRLAKREAGRLPRIRMFSNTGAALSPAMIQELSERFRGARVVRQYGQTEAKRITVMPPDEHNERLGSVGRALPGTEVWISDAAGNPLPAGRVGEIVVSGPHVMAGYWRNPEATRTVFRRDGRTGRVQLHTGDYGSLDEDGYLYFEGRRDEVFKRKGVRMSTTEIEQAAMDVAGVEAAAVVPPAEHHDLAIFAETALSASRVLKELADRLEPAKVPASCHVVDELPRTPNGKHARDEMAMLLKRSNG
ncbi:AMP-binding protein [Amycolatopsis acidiphila]|nr:AMP-binding protein [Amycolatopsis acidiphila]